MIDEAMVRGRVKLPKREKSRLAAMPESLRAELEEWLTTHNHRLLFPSPTGRVYQRSRANIEEILDRGQVTQISASRCVVQPSRPSTRATRPTAPRSWDTRQRRSPSRNIATPSWCVGSSPSRSSTVA